MIELIPLLTAIFMILSGLRILAFTSKHHRIKPLYSVLAVILIGYFFGRATSILVNETPISPTELIFMVVIFVYVMKTRGNVAQLFRAILKGF